MLSVLLILQQQQVVNIVIIIWVLVVVTVSPRDIYTHNSISMSSDGGGQLRTEREAQMSLPRMQFADFKVGDLCTKLIMTRHSDEISHFILVMV